MSAQPDAAFASGSGGELAEFALAVSTSTRCHVIVEVTSHLNQRWARSSLTTNGSTLDVTVTAIAFDERAAGIATASVCESVSNLEGLIDAVRAADAAALLASPAEDAAPFAAPVVDEGFNDVAVTLSPSTLTRPTAHLGHLIGWGQARGIELPPDALAVDAETADDPSLHLYALAARVPMGPADRYAVLTAPTLAERVGVLTDAIETVTAMVEFQLSDED